MISNSIHGQLTLTGVNQKTALIGRSLKKSIIARKNPVVGLDVFFHSPFGLQGMDLKYRGSLLHSPYALIKKNCWWSATDVKMSPSNWYAFIDTNFRYVVAHYFARPLIYPGSVKFLQNALRKLCEFFALICKPSRVWVIRLQYLQVNFSHLRIGICIFVNLDC